MVKLKSGGVSQGVLDRSLKMSVHCVYITKHECSYVAVCVIAFVHLLAPITLADPSLPLRAIFYSAVCIICFTPELLTHISPSRYASIILSVWLKTLPN